MLLNNLNVVFTLCIDSSLYTFAITCSLDLLIKNCAVLSMLCHIARQEKTQVGLPGARKCCSWVSENTGSHIGKLYLSRGK